MIDLFSMFFFLLLLPFSSSTPSIPLVITTWSSDGFQQATTNAWNSLGKGRIAALVDGLSTCERLQCDTTVGYGGSPDENGETTLDALIMDGPGHRVGSVANLHRIKDVSRVAWAIMNYTKHTMLVGESATKFALQMGFHEQELSSNVSAQMMIDWKSNKCQPNFWENVSPDSQSSCGPYKPNQLLSNQPQSPHVDRFHHDTIGMVIIDSEGNVTAGTSTNGARYKIPGRVGDSPIAGSGAYLLHDVGGAASTGDGDVMMRFLPSFHTIELMKLGTRPDRAARKSMSRILEYYPKFQGAVVAASIHGKFGAACANLGIFKYSYSINGTTMTQGVKCL